MEEERLKRVVGSLMYDVSNLKNEINTLKVGFFVVLLVVMSCLVLNFLMFVR